MDFYQIIAKSPKKGELEIFPDFKVCRSKDLMIRGKSFYAIWDEEKGFWSTDEFDVQRLVDEDLRKYKEEHFANSEDRITVKYLKRFSSKSWTNFKLYLSQMSDNYHPLDSHLTFTNTRTKKKDYISRSLSYSLEEGSIDAYDELMSTLYDEDERRKLEWAIGAIVAGDSRSIQKFIVMYGDPGSGKGTVINIVQKLFAGYWETFDAGALTSSNNQFSLSMFASNPIVAIQHDGDLSRIADNTKLNSLVSHEPMSINQKNKPQYTAKIDSFLILGSNAPIRISDSRSGILRRLIDVFPSGRRLPPRKYNALMTQIDFELGGIAHYCLEVYRSFGKDYYAHYRPIEMMYKTDVFFNFVEDSYHIFKEQDGVSLKQAYDMYKQYCEESLVEYKLPKHKFREELKSYFKTFDENNKMRPDGKQARGYYQGFLFEKFSLHMEPEVEAPCPLVLDMEESILDEALRDCLAQYTTKDETPEKKWEKVKTTLSDLNTNKLHYVQPPLNHIVIDFDLKDDTGKKSMELNLEAASQWPPTYAEFSKGGAGIHLHYIYNGDVEKLSRVYDEGIEIKVFNGNASLRRKLTKCNNLAIAVISCGLPLKGAKMINFDSVKNEKHIRALIAKCLKKEVHPGTKSNIDFIWKILDDAHRDGVKYDVTDLRPKILAFANNSTNQAPYCIKLVQQMAWASEEPSETSNEEYNEDDLVFFDLEVYPNLFMVVWKKRGGNKVTMINPSPKEIEPLLRYSLVGFNCRRYDNHILYARYLGYNLQRLYELSKKIISGSRNCFFGEAYNISYTDVYDFSSKKQSLKKFEIELGIHHMEMGIPWDQPVPEKLWPKIAEYCGNDVDATEATFDARKMDFVARLLLSDLSGLTPNDTTQMHAAKILFGNDRRPQDKFIYTDLSEMFPGYKFENGKSTYRGEETGEGGYVYAIPGMYSDVAVLDIESQHPTSLIAMNHFGPYTQRFAELKEVRLAIKHEDYDKAATLLEGMLAPYLDNKDNSEELSYALKIVINIVYGLTSAKFENKFRDPRNKDNIVAKRGALFMIDLKHAVLERFKEIQVIHIKTDSIKIPHATPEIIEFVMEFGKKYSYVFEHEATYEKMCLVNDAVFISKYSTPERCMELYGYVPKKVQKLSGQWSATGTQFAHPYVFKTLFSHEKITFNDICETKSVTSALYLDMNEDLSIELGDEHNYQFIGKVGAFCPVIPGAGGGLLCREKDGKYYAATGSKGYRWLEAEMVKILKKEKDIDRSYYDHLVNEAVKNISKYGDFEWFVEDESELLLA